jgi:hypothetical protein
VDRWQTDWACEIFNLHHLKLYHRNQEVTFKRRTRYTGSRTSSNNVASYADRPNKLTEEPFCLHCEWRIRGAAALRQANITCLDDYPNYDFRRFWEKRLILCAIDLEKLGRLYHIYVLGKPRRRTPWIDCNYNMDLSLGQKIFHSLRSEREDVPGTATQDVIDKLRHLLPINQCLVKLNVEHLLPPDNLGGHI